MKKQIKTTLVLLLLLALWMGTGTGHAQEQKYSVVFYNVENLFDTHNDEGVLDEEFTPDGPYKWDEKRYAAKLDKLSEAIYKIAAATSGYPIIIGVCEVENRGVLQDLANTERLLPAGYRIAHYDSPEARGVDVAFFYRPDVFKYIESVPIRVTLPDNPRFRTRDILRLSGTIDGETFHCFVNHWPSRRGGQQISEPKRVAAAQILRNVIDSLTTADPEAKFIIMGDFNDDPNNKSLEKTLGAKGRIKDLGPGDLFNPMYALFKDGFGTLAYNDTWNVFDNIIVSANLVNNAQNTFQVYRPGKNKHYAFIFNKPFLMQQEGRFKGYPLRTFVGTNYQGGYSDHFPVYLYIAK
jgi:predicted extracellular nuclease